MSAWPQASTGTVRGTVRDQSGAVIPAATLRLANTATNVETTTNSTESGYYVFPGVVPGAYRLICEVPGMKSFEAAVTVQVQQAATIDPVMSVAGLATEVDVVDMTPVVTADAPTMGHVLERRRIEQLPLNGRSFSQLLNTVPGVTDWAARAYGTRAGSGDLIVDGAVAGDRNWGNWGSDVNVRLESVEEFKVETNNSSAKFARPLTAVVSTRSGTNQFHGSLFETHRSNSIGKARRREEYWEKAPLSIRNEYGGSAGGPVWIPKLYNGRSRTFWFFAFEGSRSANPSTRSYRVPTEAMRRGDFSGLVDGQGRLMRLYDPLTTNSATWARQPFNHGGRLNVIDPARISPLAKYLYGLTPLPTHPDVNPLVDANLWVRVPLWGRSWQTTGRLDHQFSENDRFYARVTRGESRSRILAGSNISEYITDPDIGQVIDGSDATTIALSYTKVLSPSLFNELLVSGTRLPYSRILGEQRDFTSELGLPNPLGVAGFPQLDNTGLTGYAFNGGNNRARTQNFVIVNENVTKIKGRHEFQFGGSYRYEQLNIQRGTAPSMGNHNFNTFATALYDSATARTNPQATPQTGHNLANMFLGVLNYNAPLQRGWYYLTDNEYALYFQDNFRVNSRLTLNLGLRWEYWGAYKEKLGVMSSFDPERRAVVLAQDLGQMYAVRATFPSVVNRLESLGAKFITAEEAGMPSALTRGNYDNFGPRLGFAYRLGDDKRAAVLRGGYRASYFRLPIGLWYHRAAVNPPFNANFAASLNDAAQTPDGISNYGMRSVPAVIAGVNSGAVVGLEKAGSLTRGSSNIGYLAEDQPDARVQDWNLTLEKEVAQNVLARVAYIGNHGSRMPQTYTYNSATPEYIWFSTTGQRLPTGEYANVARRPYDQQVYGNIEEVRRTGWSNFNGVQLELERRYDRGFGFQIFYVAGNALATGSQDVDAVSPVPSLNQFMPGLVPEDESVRNRFLNYQRDITVPKHMVRWNWIADIPIGRGKPLGGNFGGVLDKIAGGWQIAGSGSLRSNYFTLPTSFANVAGDVEIYGYKYPIQDCRSGRCQPGYLWWNGYIPANQINSYDAQGRPNGVMGVPEGYKPAAEPLLPWPHNPNRNDPMYQYFGTNTVWVTLKDGTPQRTTYNPGIHAWQQQYMPGIRTWGLDASLFKTVKLTEKVALRFNADFFNVLNHPGNPNNIAASGILNTQSSGNGARQTQLSLRLNW
jgi:hypothetical protein